MGGSYLLPDAKIKTKIGERARHWSEIEKRVQRFISTRFDVMNAIYVDVASAIWTK